MTAWFARHDVAANLLMVTIVLGGLIALKTRIPLEIFPDLQFDVVTIRVDLRGAAPADVEQGVAIRLEEAVQDLQGIRRLTSQSTEGSAIVSLELATGADARRLLEEVKVRVDALNTLPAAAEKPIIELAERRREVITVAVAGAFDELELRQFAERVRDDLLRDPGISQAILDGVRAYEIAIEADRDSLRGHGLDLDDIAAAIAASSLDLSAGNLRTRGGDVLVRSQGQAYARAAFENIVIRTGTDGSILHLGDVATVHDAFEELPLRTRFNGQPAALVEIYRIGQQSAIDVAERVHAYIASRQDDLPRGLTLAYWDDNSRVVRSRLRTLLVNAAQGGILVVLLLALFLKPAVALWVFIGIPVSFMGAFIVMALLGATINVLSLFGFILVLGIVVDDAIVTGENVYTHLRRGRDGLAAAVDGTREIAMPVTFGVLTTIAAFVPLAFMEGARAVLFTQIPYVVIPVLVFSLIESKFVLPAHLKHVKARKGEAGSRLERWQQDFADGFERAVLWLYAPLLERCLRQRYLTLAVFVAVLLVFAALIFAGWTRFVFFPRVEGETARANLVMPVGTPFATTDGHIERIADAAAAIADDYRDRDGQRLVTDILAVSGAGEGGASGQPHLGRVEFQVLAPEQRNGGLGIGAMVDDWRARIGLLPGAEELSFRAELGRTSAPIDVQLSGPELAELTALGTAVKTYLAGYPGVFDITDSLARGKQEIQLDLTATGHALGLTRGEVMRQVRQAYFGTEVQRVQRGRDDVRVLVRLPLAERSSWRELEDLPIRTPAGQEVPLAEVASFATGRAPAALTRVDRYRTLNVTADVDKETVNMGALQADLGAELARLVAARAGVSYRLEGEAREQRESFASLTLGLALLLFVIYALLAIPFNSFVQPLIVMAVIPFGAIGAVLGHWLLGLDLTIMSAFGLLALTGVVVNDSLVLVQFVNRRRASGAHELADCVRTAGVARFRPVMLTSLTTFIGLSPLLLERATQAQFLIPMAVSLGFGVLFATAVTLILVPVNYLVLEDLLGLWRRLRGVESLAARS